MDGTFTYRFSVVARYPARLEGNDSHVTVNLVAGHDGHHVYCGTLTMSEDEWETFVTALRSSLGQAIQVDDPTGGDPRTSAEAGRAIG